MFKTVQYLYWNIGYILSDAMYELKMKYFYNNSSYYYHSYGWRDDTLLNEIYKLEERIAELEDSKDEKTDIVLVVNQRKNIQLDKLKRNKSF
jgi:hypothetical protein